MKLYYVRKHISKKNTRMSKAMSLNQSELETVYIYCKKKKKTFKNVKRRI